MSNSYLDKLKGKVLSKINNESYKIQNLIDYSNEEMLKIFKWFSRQIVDIYWYQKKSFLKLLEGWDRKCYLLEMQGKPIWVLAFKTELQSDVEWIKIEKWYLEIKSLFLFDEFGKWNIRKLRYELIKIIEMDYPNADWIFVTVSENLAKSSLAMFKSVWFKEIWREYNKYWNLDSEVFLYYPLS